MDTEKKPNREITYQVGWKKGSIRKECARHAQAAEDELRLEAAGDGGRIATLLSSCMWRQVPVLPESWLAAAFWVLPAVSFGLIVALVYYLMRAS